MCSANTEEDEKTGKQSGRERMAMTMEVAIEINGLTKRYEEKTAVDHLNLRVFRGEIFGLLGPNEAGKTTTTLMLTGLTEPTEGTALIGGLDCVRDTMKVKKTVGYMPDNVGFYGDMTGRENLRFTAAPVSYTHLDVYKRQAIH